MKYRMIRIAPWLVVLGACNFEGTSTVQSTRKVDPLSEATPESGAFMVEDVDFDPECRRKQRCVANNEEGGENDDYPTGRIPCYDIGAERSITWLSGQRFSYIPLNQARAISSQNTAGKPSTVCVEDVRDISLIEPIELPSASTQNDDEGPNIHGLVMLEAWPEPTSVSGHFGVYMGTKAESCLVPQVDILANYRCTDAQ